MEKPASVTPVPPQSTGNPLELVHGLWKAMVAKTLVELEIPDKLVGGQRTVTDLANETGTRPDLLYRFLRAAASCQFIAEVKTAEDSKEGIFTSSDVTRTFCSGQSTYFLIRHLLAGFEVEAWNRLGDNLRTGERSIDAVLGMSLWEYLDTHPQENQNFNGSMTMLSESVNSPLVKAYPDFAQMETVVDVGGGQGSFLITILQAHPTLRGIVFDRQQVVDQTRTRIARVGLDDRCTCVAGSFMEEVPPGASAYTFKNVLHDWDDQQTLHILRNVRQAAREGAKVLLVELLVADTNPSFAVCSLDLEMLIETGGKQRTAREFGTLLQQAGFTLERVIPVGRTPYSIIEGKAH